MRFEEKRRKTLCENETSGGSIETVTDLNILLINFNNRKKGYEKSRQKKCGKKNFQKQQLCAAGATARQITMCWKFYTDVVKDLAEKEASKKCTKRASRLVHKSVLTCKVDFMKWQKKHDSK